MRTVSLLLLLIVGCRSTPVQPTVEVTGGLIVVDARPELHLPVDAVIEGGEWIVCRRHLEGDPIHYLTIQRRGDDIAYGIYGLWRAKNGLPVDFPLDGEPIAYDDRDHVETLTHLLGKVGLGAEAAAEVLRAHESDWFGPGLRVLMTFDPTLAAAVLGDHLPTRDRPALVRFELPAPPSPTATARAKSRP